MAKKAIKSKKKRNTSKERPAKPSPSREARGTQNEPKNESGRPREWTEDVIEIERQALVRWISNSHNYYFLDFLIERDLDWKQIERFCGYSERFRQTYEKARQVQEARLVHLAVTKKGDGSFIKFVLQNKAGWKEKSEVSGDASNPLAVILDRIGATSRDPLDYDE